MFLIVAGNPIDGFEYIGPFEDSESAIAWGDSTTNRYMEWWIVRLLDPNQE